MQKQIYIILILSLVILSCQDVNSLVESIAKSNIVECESVGYAGRSSEQYSKFRKLGRGASKNELIKLLGHDSLAVVAYSSYVLIDKELFDPAKLLARFIDDEEIVTTFCGCSLSGDVLSSLIYHRYWSSRIEFPDEYDFENRILNDSEDLKKMDSVIFYSTNPDWLLLSRALDNRIYSDAYNEIIQEWAFVRNDFNAINYVFKNLRKGNELALIESINDYMINPEKHEAQKRQLTQIKNEIEMRY